MAHEKRLYHSVADQILRLITSGEFPPGSRLPGERELAEKFEVSRVTVREAEIALQALGHLSIKTGSGVFVLSPTARAEESLPHVSPFELTEARLLFESEAAALAARHIDDKTLLRLEELVQRMASKNPSDEEDSQLADREFHLAIAAASGNSAVRYVVEMLWRMRTQIPEIRQAHAAICAEEDARDRGLEHAEILEALKGRNPAKSRSAMQNHFRRLLGSMIDVTEEQALRNLRHQATRSRERYLQSTGS
jgi:GntR family transcriptional regulator, hexuronate regulon transcriptional repressor